MKKYIIPKDTRVWLKKENPNYTKLMLSEKRLVYNDEDVIDRGEHEDGTAWIDFRLPENDRGFTSFELWERDIEIVRK